MDDEEQSKQLEMVVNGDGDALQGLIVSYHATLHRLVDREIDGGFRRQIDPDDVLQEAYVAAFKHMGACRFDTPAGFYKWLERIARNYLIDRQRALKTKKRDVGREVPVAPGTSGPYQDQVQALACTMSTPSRHMGMQEATSAMMSSLARLTDDQRAVVKMRYLEGRRVAEIATTLGKTENAVHVLCHRGLNELRELMVSITKYLSRL
jgi:RNA polymerase sigma-70 factor (subfamily 1)